MTKPLDPIPTLARMTEAHDRAVAERDALRAELVKADARHDADSAMLSAAHDVCERKDREIERLTARVEEAGRARDAPSRGYRGSSTN
jgi:hypothetical protein